jgi:RNA polymerase sigma-70 factor (ECF subfamily)
MVFKLIREDGLTYKQVAEIMGISDQTVEVHLKLAIQYFRKEITVFLGQRNLYQMVQNRGDFPAFAIFLLPTE